MDLDLNEEPLDLATDSVLGPTCDEVEDRIRLLEVVYARSRCQQTRLSPQNPLVNTPRNEGRKVKRGSSDLVAKALDLDTDTGVTKAVGDGKGFFDCNTCLGKARDPVLTCCGHLFCWVCFYRLEYAYANAKECPVCKGEVTEATVTPIYGSHVPEPGPDAWVPPRPRANRIEVVRKTLPTNSMDLVPVADVYRRIRMAIGGMRHRRSRLMVRALSEVDDLSTSSMLPRMFSSGDLLVEGDDVVVEEMQDGSTVGFPSESPVAEPRGRRRRQRGE